MIERQEGSVLHQQALSALGFLLGLVLTSLVLILNDPSSFRVGFGALSGEQYFQTLVTYVAIVGALSGVGLLAFLDVGGGLSKKSGFVDRFGTVLFFLSVFGFMGVLPLLLVPFSVFGAVLVLTLEVVLVAAYAIGRSVSEFSSHGRKRSE